MPMTCAVPVCGASAAITSRSSGDSSSTSEISRATARASPARARSTRSGTSASRLRDTHDQGVALPTAAAQGGRTDAAAATLELEREMQHDPGPGHADRVAQGDRSAVHVDLLVGEAELAGRGDADRRERLVELHEVQVGRGDALLLAR